MRLLQLFDNIGNCKFCYRIRFHSLGTTFLLDAPSQNEKFNLKHGVKVERYLRERERERRLFIFTLSLTQLEWPGLGLARKY